MDGARRARAARRRGDAGFTLVELIAAMSIFGIILTLVVGIIAYLSATTYRSINVSQQTNTAQVGVARAEQFLTGVVPPMVAATSSFPSSTATSPSLSSTTPCWGTSQPASTTIPSTSTTIPSTGQSLTSPSRTSISLAHDYDLVWCGYAPNSSTASVYEGSLSGCSGTYGNCTFTVNSFGSAGCVPGVGSPSANGSNSGCTSASTVLSIAHVWCDAYCQGTSGATKNAAGTSVPVACIDVAGNTSSTCANDTPPLFSYFASGNGRYTTTINDAAVVSGQTTATFSSSGTPGISAGMSITGAGIAAGTTVSSVTLTSGDSYTLTMSAAATATPAGGTESLTVTGTNYQNSLNYSVANETTTCPSGTQLFLDLAQSSSSPSTCADPTSFLPGIQNVTLNLTILSNNGKPGGGTSAGQASTGSAATAGATIDNQILLANQLQANQSCGSTTFEYPPDLTSLFPLDSTSNPQTDLGQTSNGTSQTDVQMQYTTNTNAAPTNANGAVANPTLTSTGPVPCNASSTPGTAFNGTDQYLIDDYWDTPTPTTACAQAVPCLWGTSSSTGMTVEAAIEVPAGTSASTRERIVSIGDASGSTAATAQGIELALKPASAAAGLASGGTVNCGENGGNLSGYQPGGIVASIDGGSWFACLPTGLAANTWYLVAATFTWTASTASAVVYISGSGSVGATDEGTDPLAGLSSYLPSNAAGCPLVIGAAANSTGLTTGCTTGGVPANFFDGDIADVATFSTALTSTQILTQYNELLQ
jgi:prepilin-type N-terminal cleavage/methylation domain-containing protein